MDAPPLRRLEELSVGLYVPLVMVSGLVVVAVLQIDAPFVAVFFAFWLIVLCLIAATGAAMVVLVANGRRARTGGDYDLRAVAFAVAIPASIAVAVAVLIAGPSPGVTEAVLLGAGAVALLVAPAGLFVTILGASVRRRLWAEP